MTKGELKLSVTQDRPVLSIEDGAVAYLHPVDAAELADRPRVVTVDIPVGLAVTPKTVKLTEGWWSIDVVLPSGERLQDDVEISGGRTSEVELKAADSPRETLIWQQLAGQISSPETRPEPLQPQSSRVEHDEKAFGAFLRGVGSYDPDVTAGPTRFFESTAATFYDTHNAPKAIWNYLEQVAKKEFPYAPSCWVKRGQIRRDFDDFYVIYRPSELSAEDDKTLWAEIGTAKRSSLVYVPTRWVTKDHDDREANILVRRNPDDRGLAEVVIEDAEVASMLGFLTHGRLAEADRLADRFQDWLFHKITNPLAAAAGGYVLLANRLAGEKTHWHEWICNLNRWFPDLPDGAILEGYMCLNGPEGVRNRDRAAECFSNAYDRGMPAYAIGLSWLRGGLETFASSDPGLAEKAETVSMVSRLIETNHAFTAFRMW